MDVGLHTASATDESVCASARTCVCAFAHNSHNKTMEVLRGWNLGAVWMSVLLCVCVACVCVCVVGGGGKHHCGRQADGDGNEQAVSSC